MKADKKSLEDEIKKLKDDDEILKAYGVTMVVEND